MSAESYPELRAELVETCRRMSAQRLTQGTSGNVSVRTPYGFLVTPSGVDYEAMTPDMVVEMDLDGTYFGAFRPTTEWRFHRDILKARPEANAVVHTHSMYSTVFSCLRRDIPAVHYMIAATGGSMIRCAGYATFGSQRLSDNALAALGDTRACLLANHGLIVLGSSLKKALGLAVEVETLAEQYWRALAIGAPTVLDDAEMGRIHDLFKTYGSQEAVDDVLRCGGAERSR